MILSRRVIERTRTWRLTIGLLVPLTLGLFSSGAPARAGLMINATFESSVTSLSNAASVESAFNYAAQQFENLFSDNINVNITVKAVAGTGTLGESSTSLLGALNYAQTRTEMINDVKSADDATAVASLPSADPTGGGLFDFAKAEAKALGIIADDHTNDGTFTFGSGFSYTFDPNNRAVAGEIDFIGVAEHDF